MDHLSKARFLFILAFIFSITMASAQQLHFGKSGIITYGTKPGIFTIQLNGKEVLAKAFSAIELDGKTITSKGYAKVTYSKKAINDQLGKGTKHVFQLAGNQLPEMEQIFYTYPNRNYFLMELKVSGKDIKTNSMSPILSEIQGAFAAQGLTSLMVPFDNDTFISYEAKQLADNRKSTSAEVTALYNAGTRNGLVLGSIDQTNWKSGVKTKLKNGILNIDVECGFTDVDLTRDKIPHGYLSGNSVLSSKILVGYFNDWRLGMEEFAKAVKLNQDRFVFKWKGPTPIGWNSWGVMQEKISLEKANKVVDFFADSLKVFKSGNDCYIDLDSYWDNMVRDGDYSKLKSFADYCKQKGLKPGIYWAPFTDWGFGGGGNRKSPEGTYNFSEMWTKVGNGYHDFDGARALDPTHPGTQQRVKYMVGKFKECGFGMIKIDFLGHAAAESDHFYNPNITTGMQAYKAGMEYLLTELDGKMLVYAAISPSLATGRYVHVRRIACDAFKSIKDTEYTLNSVTNGWWQTYFYDYIDADHVVFGNESEDTNVSRMLSAVVTGTFISGDDFSKNGKWKERAKQLFQNAEILAILKDGKAFRPTDSGIKKGASNIFQKQIGEVHYIALFNYEKTAKEIEIDFNKLGFLNSKSLTAKELISGESKPFIDHSTIKLKPEQAIVLKIISSK